MASTDGKTETALREEDHGNFETEDDSDVGLRSVLDDALSIKLDVQDFSQHGPITGAPARCSSNEGLVSGEESENMWSYTDEGVLWCEVTEVLSDDGIESE
ncbi:hypothetical protein B0H16DRAFT_1459918 [Mycena metata]|nr:hypothetical protein B0H16DRAFT_1459918 [Mycena metata]